MSAIDDLLSLYDGDAENATGKPKPVVELSERIRTADGVIIATPRSLRFERPSKPTM